MKHSITITDYGVIKGSSKKYGSYRVLISPLKLNAIIEVSNSPIPAPIQILAGLKLAPISLVEMF